MTTRWTRQQVEQFAPDPKSVKAALKLARPGPWSETGSTDTLVWGKCQGSGSTAYQVSIDLTGPAAKCSCPSRKFPCKHGIALLFLWVEGDGLVSEAAEAADFAGDWAEGRAKRAAAQVERRTEKQAAEPVDPEASARRLAKRHELMTAGAAEFEVWLADLYRQGLAAARRQPYAFWDAAAARLLDSQLPGLAARVRSLPEHLHGRDDWADRVLIESGLWYTAVRAWSRRDALGPDDLGNLRAFLGWAVPTEEVRQTTPVGDTWVVEGVHRTEDGRLQAQRTWLRGLDTGERLVVLDFAPAGANLGVAQLVGSVIGTPLHAYPGSGLRRGLFATDPVTDTFDHRPSTSRNLSAALDDAAARLAANPFLDHVPLSVTVRFAVDERECLTVLDDRGDALPVVEDFDPWPLLARVADNPTPMFGELADGRIRPLAVAVDDALVAL